MITVSAVLAIEAQRARHVTISAKFKDAAMKFMHLLILTIGLFLLCSCSIFKAKQSPPAAGLLAPKPLVLPVGKNWQVIEEAPKLSDERGRLPFQTEQSVQPEVAKPVSPEENRKIEMSH